MFRFASNIEVRLSNIGLFSPDNYIREEYTASATATAAGDNIDSLLKNSKNLSTKLCRDLFYAYSNQKFIIRFIGVITITIKNKDGNIIQTLSKPFKLSPNSVGVSESCSCWDTGTCWC
jgi:hypothetical protein